MTSPSAGRSRGRPKTMSRENTVEIAMRAYWEAGIDGVSVNEICKLAKVSKSSAYREFGSEDGLMLAALNAYAAAALRPLHDMLAADVPFTETLAGLIEFVANDRSAMGLPEGCLFVDLCNNRDRVGPLTQAQVDELREQTHVAYAAWIDRAKASGELQSEIPTATAALYVDSQLENAMTQLRRGDSVESVTSVVELALSVFLSA